MRRAAILATLVLLMLAVAGVTSAREGAFSSLIRETHPGSQETESTQSAVPETTTPEVTAIGDITETGKSPDVEETGEAAKPAAHPAVPVKKADEQERKPGKDRMRDVKNSDTGKPRHVGKPLEHGRPTQAGVAKPEEAARKIEPERVQGRRKVSVCHQGKTLKIGAPAEEAHLRHGDSSGACKK